MSTQLVDAAVGQALLVPATTIVASTTYPGVLVYPRRLATSAWVLDVTNAATTGSYSFLLEASDVVGGTYAEVSRLVWPSGAAGPQQLALGVSGSLGAVVAPESQYLRVRVVVGGATPSLSFTSWLGKPGGAVGLGVRPGNTYAAV